jgi:hypothetical protein
MRSKVTEVCEHDVSNPRATHSETDKPGKSLYAKTTEADIDMISFT